MFKKEEKLEVKKNNYLLIIIVALVFIVGLGAGYIIAKKDVLKTTKETKTEEKQEEKETKEVEEKEEKTEEKEESTTPSKDKKENEIPEGCVVCDEEGGLCCGVDGDEKENYPQAMDIENFVAYYTKQNKDDCGTDFGLDNGNEVHQLKFRKEGNKQTLVVDNEKLFSKYDTNITKVALLDNGMVVIEYYEDTDQARLKTRDYYTNNLKSVKRIEGISYKNDILSTEFEYIEVGKVCVNDEYKENKYYKATIKDTSVETKYIRTEKEYNCAGMV